MQNTLGRPSLSRATDMNDNPVFDQPLAIDGGIDITAEDEAGTKPLSWATPNGLRRSSKEASRRVRDTNAEAYAFWIQATHLVPRRLHVTIVEVASIYVAIIGPVDDTTVIVLCPPEVDGHDFVEGLDDSDMPDW
jgi:hypothetical protein